MVFANDILSSPHPPLSYVAQYRPEDALRSSSLHRRAQQFADQNVVLAIVLLQFADSFALLLVLLSAVVLAFFTAEADGVTATACKELRLLSSTNEAGRNFRCWLGVLLLRSGDLLLLGAVVRMDGVFEVHVRE